MILAAGRGERMRPLTAHTPKPMLRVGGKPLLAYHIEKLVAAGFHELVINVSWLGEQIVAHFEDNPPGCLIHWSREPEPLETAGGIIQALPLLGEGPFALVNGDTWTDYPFDRFRRMAPPGGGAHLVLVDNPPQHPGGDFAIGEGGSLTRPDEGARLTYSGLGVYDPAMFSGSVPGKQPLLPFLLSAMGRGRLSGEHYPGRWEDVGTPQRLAALDAELGFH
jgi:MurNAc alpha-1-phosphate uridylyltransferase